MNRLLVVVLLFCLALLCSCGALGFDPCSPNKGRPPFKLASDSLQSAYSVHLEERFESGYDYLVGAKIFKEGRLVAEEPRFAVRECDDGRSFETQFRHFEWVKENVFRAGWNQSSLEAKDETVLVRNDTTKTLSELVVGGYGEILLVVELQPKSSVKFLRKHHIDVDAIAIWIAGGKFHDGKQVGETYHRFKEEDLTDLKICVAVKNDTVEIESRKSCE